jgi:hypothetical protein
MVLKSLSQSKILFLTKWTYFQQTVGKPIGTNCAPLLADLFFHSYEADFTQELLKKNEKKLSRSFNFTFRYIDYVLSLNNYRLGDFVDCIYPIELCFLCKIRSVSSYHHMNATKQHHLTVMRLRDGSQISKPIENTVPDQKYTCQWGSCCSIFSFLCCFVDCFLSCWPFSFGHCIVYPSSIYGFMSRMKSW